MSKYSSPKNVSVYLPNLFITYNNLKHFENKNRQHISVPLEEHIHEN
jgi:hypothetical protein